MFDYVTGNVKNLADNEKDDYPQDKAMEEVIVKEPPQGESNQNNLTSSISSKPVSSGGSVYKPLAPYSNKLEGYLKSHKAVAKVPSKPIPYIGEGQIYTPEIRSKTSEPVESKAPAVESKTAVHYSQFQTLGTESLNREAEDTTFVPNLSNQNLLENLIKDSPLNARKRQEIHPSPALHVLQFVGDELPRHHDVIKKRPAGIYTAKRGETVNGRKDFLNVNKPGENPFGPKGLHRDIIQNVLKQYRNEANDENEAKRRAIMELHKLAKYQDKIRAKHKKRRKRLPVVFKYNGQDEHVNVRMHEWDDVDVWPHAHGHDFDHEFDHHDPNQDTQVKRRRKTNVARVTTNDASKMADIVGSKKTNIFSNVGKERGQQHFEADLIDLTDDNNDENDVIFKDGNRRSGIKVNPYFDPETVDEESSGSGEWNENREYLVDFKKTGAEEELVDFPPFSKSSTTASINEERSSLAPFSSAAVVGQTGNKKSGIERSRVMTSTVSSENDEKFFENTKVSFDGTENYVTLPAKMMYFDKFDDDTVDELPNVGATNHRMDGGSAAKSFEVKDSSMMTKLSAENLIPATDNNAFESIAPEQSALTPSSDLLTPAENEKSAFLAPSSSHIGNLKTLNHPSVPTKKYEKHHVHKQQQDSLEQKRYLDMTSSSLKNNNDSSNEDDDETNKDGGQSSGSVKHEIENNAEPEERESQASLISADNIGDLGKQAQTTTKNSKELLATSKLPKVLEDEEDNNDVTKYSNADDNDNDQGLSFVCLFFLLCSFYVLNY